VDLHSALGRSPRRYLACQARFPASTVRCGRAVDVAALLPGMPRRHCSGALYEVAEAPDDDKRRDGGRRGPEAPLRSHHLADGRGWCANLPIYRT